MDLRIERSLTALSAAMCELMDASIMISLGLASDQAAASRWKFHECDSFSLGSPTQARAALTTPSPIFSIATRHLHYLPRTEQVASVGDG